MTGKWSDISHEADKLPNNMHWVPDTPDFLQKRAKRQQGRVGSAVSYTQVKAAIHAESSTRRASIERTRGNKGSATVINFEHLEGGRRKAPVLTSRNLEAGRRRARPSSGRSNMNAKEGFLFAKVRHVRHQSRHHKADREFERRFRDTPREETGPRAAVYEGHMGRRHRQAARLQDGERNGLLGGFSLPALPSIPVVNYLMSRRYFAVTSIVVMCLIFVTVSVFPEAQRCYVQMRMNDQAVAEYQAVLDRNRDLENHVAALQTDEGMEELAHENLGWVREGEQSVSVIAEGSSDIGSAASSEDAGSIASGSVETPATWYSPVLDTVFGYEG